MAKLKDTTCGDISSTSSNLLPVGSIIKWYKSSPPDETWKICDGALISKITYFGLWEILGHVDRFGDGTEENHFKVPDLQARFTRGCNSTTLYNKGGSITHNHNINSHRHSQNHAHNMSHYHTGTHNHSTSHTHKLNSHNHSTSHLHSQTHYHTATASTVFTLFALASHLSASLSHANEAHSHTDTTSTYSSNTGTTAGAMVANNVESGISTNTYTGNNSTTVYLGTNNSLTTDANNTNSGYTSASTTDNVAAPYRALYYIIKVL